MKIITTRLVLLSLVTVLVACGGGGGGGSNNPPPPPPSDTSPPTVSSILPIDNATEVELDTVITIQFSETIDTSTVDTADFVLSQNSSTVPGTFSFDSATNTISFAPSFPLLHSLLYQIDLNSAINDMAGNPLASNQTWTFTTRGVRWSTPQTINSNNLSTSEPSIVLGPNNDLIAYWIESASSTKNIWTVRYQEGQGWGTPYPIFEDANEQSSSTQMAAFSGGSVWSLWLSHNLMTDVYTVKRAGLNSLDGSWSPSDTVDGGSNGPPARTRFRTSGNSTGMVFIIRNDGINHSLFARHASGGVISSTETLLESINYGPTRDVVAGMDDFGNALVVWTQWNGTKGAAYANRYSANTGQWDIAPSRIDTGGTSTVFEGAENAKLAVSGNGDAMAVWAEEKTTTTIYANKFVLGSGWQGATILAAGLPNSTFFPNVAMFPNGDAVAAWSQGNGSGGLQVNYRLFRSGIWQSTVPLATNGYSNYDPVVATGTNDEAVIAWGHVDSQLDKVSIYASRFDGNSSFLAAEKISVGLDNSQNYLSNGAYGDDENALVIDANGIATLIWREVGNGPSTVQTSRIE